MAQSQEQIAFIIQQWEARYKPATLLSTDHNVAEIISWVNRQGGEITIQKLVDAVRNLGDIDNGGRLQYHHAPKEVVVFKAPEKSAHQLRQEELVAKDIAGFQRGVRTEFDRVQTKYQAPARAEYISSPDDPSLPFVASSMPPLNSKSDLDHNFPLDVYKFWHHGQHQVAFRKRVNIVLKRHAAALAAAAAEQE
jgi:hypothetical protein